MNNAKLNIKFHDVQQHQVLPKRRGFLTLDGQLLPKLDKQQFDNPEIKHSKLPNIPSPSGVERQLVNLSSLALH